MDSMDVTQGLVRWLHIVAGVLWIGLLYFFNFVNGPFAATMDGDTKKKVVPELMPRALYFFRWGAAYTWVSGLILLFVVFYHGGLMVGPGGEPNPMAHSALAFVLIGPMLYDLLFKSSLGKDIRVGAAICFVVLAAYVLIMDKTLGMSYRAYNIHLGGLLGTTMAMNVWMRIWPGQRKIIAAVKAGTPPDPAVVAMAGARSRHNTYMSVPLIWTMINAHTTFASGSSLALIAIIPIGWLAVYLLYKKAGQVKGF
jgi:uncharacterized membrane protein